MTGTKTIVRLASRGDGVTDDGRYVAFAAPGDRVDEAGRIEPGLHHVIPPCCHFPECGGCQLQHVDDLAYSDYLRDRVKSALAAQAVAPVDVHEPSLSPPNTRRRASLRAERRGGRTLLGFNAQASHLIVDMRECHILHPILFALIGPLRDLLTTLIPSRGGAELRLTLADQGPDILIGNVAVEGLEANEKLVDFARRNGVARLAIDDGYGAQTLWEPTPVEITLGGVAVPLPYGAFLQATAEGEAALVAAVREAVAGANIVADLFAGLGTFALSLPGRILAVEGAREAALALKAAANRAERTVFVDHRDLFRRPLDRPELDRFEAIVLDPPRAGAKEQVALLAGSGVTRIAYVSCNPATFARDSRILIDGGYHLSWIKPVGQFRWSTHVELVGCFERPRDV